MEELVTLVDENDQEQGSMDKLLAHAQGRLHRAFSIMIFNEKNELLLQQRAWHKYHSAGLWTNTCCSHQRPGENTLDAAARRLQEEMGIRWNLQLIGKFIYNCELDDQLFEHELDYILTGIYNQEPIINHDEVANWKWANLSDLKADITLHPENYTYWFKALSNSEFFQIPHSK